MPCPPVPNPSEKDMHRSFAIVALAASGLFAFTATATAETITVCAVDCDHTSINAAIDASADGDVIQLAAETYQEGSVIDTVGKAITIQGTTGKDGAPTSILDGANFHRILQCTCGETETTIFKDLVIQNGQCQGGAGMRIEGSSPTMENCTFKDNTIDDGPCGTGLDEETGLGGGMAIRNGNPTVVDCRFIDNSSPLTGGGMSMIDDSRPILRNCIFEGNYALAGDGGAAIYCMNSSAITIESCVFNDSYTASFGGAILAKDSSNITILDCAFSGNHGYDGGAIFMWNCQGGVMADCEFAGNECTEDGGAIYNWKCTGFSFTRCEFQGNEYGYLGGGVFNDDCSGLSFEDCSFEGNVVRPDGSICHGGGISNLGSSLAIMNCTFVDNQAYVGGGIWNSEDSTLDLQWCRFWCNQPDAIVGGILSGSDNCINNDCVECPDLANEDDDDDGVPNIDDICPGGDDNLDIDEDGTPDGCDGCPGDPFKTHPGNCGCGVDDSATFGDLDCDGDYDEDDIRLGMKDFGIIERARGDMDGDGDADRVDWEILGSELGICVGDLNGDLQIDAADLGLLIGAWGLCP